MFIDLLNMSLGILTNIVPGASNFLQWLLTPIDTGPVLGTIMPIQFISIPFIMSFLVVRIVLAVKNAITG